MNTIVNENENQEKIWVMSMWQAHLKFLFTIISNLLFYGSVKNYTKYSISCLNLTLSSKNAKAYVRLYFYMLNSILIKMFKNAISFVALKTSWQI